MTTLPTVNQFPSFVSTVSFLSNDEYQCIWYLPNRKRCCRVPITGEDNQRAFQLANSVWKAPHLATSALQNLAQIAEICCCSRHHRNKIWGSGLAQELADLWYIEIRIDLGLPEHRMISNIKVDWTPDSSMFVTFAKHQTVKEESLLSKLLSDIDPGACRTGSVYIYTHAEEAFRGMVKIGYTGKTIRSRLEKWAQCGHGYPTLVGSFGSVRHPERVELLVHFELVECWYAQRWCKFHRKAHIEWFEVDLHRAATIIRLWCQWMQGANPYDRRGELKSIWRAHIEFLVHHDNPITAEAMVQIQRIEEGSDEVRDFLDDKALRKRQDAPVKKDEGEEHIESPA